MDFVYNVYAVFPLLWRVANGFPERPDLIDTIVGGSVYLQNVQTATICNSFADLAVQARCGGGAFYAVE
jgi:hypothetical protein